MNEYKRGLLTAARILSSWSVSVYNPTGKVSTEEAKAMCMNTIQELWEQIITESKKPE